MIDFLQSGNPSGVNPTKLFIGRLPKGTTESHLKRYFATYGHIVDVFVPNPHRGFGFVTFSSSIDASRVVRMHHTLQVCLETDMVSAPQF